jgi:cobalamin biosynthesis Mg chelatase CobN
MLNKEAIKIKQTRLEELAKEYYQAEKSKNDVRTKLREVSRELTELGVDVKKQIEWLRAKGKPLAKKSYSTVYRILTGKSENKITPEKKAKNAVNTLKKVIEELNEIEREKIFKELRKIVSRRKKQQKKAA